MNKEKTEEKLKTLTLAELNTLVDLLENELITRYREDHKQKVQKTMTAPLPRSVKQPASDRKRNEAGERSTSILGDPNGDVLWKHHGVTEQEAHDQANEF